MNNFEYKTRELKAKTLEESKRSIKKYSEKRGVSVEQIQAEIRTSRRFNLIADEASYESANLPGGKDEYYRLIEGKSFWEVLDFEHSFYLKQYAQVILSMAGSDLLNKPYIGKIATQLGIPPDTYADEKSFLKDFILLIPHIYLYEYELNAFLMGRSVIDGFPAVFAYQTLFGVLQNLTSLFVRNLFTLANSENHNQVRYASTDEIHYKSNDLFVKLGLIYNIDSLLGRNFESIVDMTAVPGVEPIVQTCITMVQNFVMLHEYGHLMRGHLESTGPRIDLEYEADFFAYTALCKYSIDNKIPFYTVMMTISTIFFSLHVRDVVFKHPVSTHPPAIERFQYLLRSTPSYEACTAALRFWNNIALLTNTILQEHYNLSIAYFDIPKK